MRILERLTLAAVLMALPIHAEDLEGDGWRLDLGLSYLATGGNTETSSLGFTSEWERLEDRWHYLAGAEAHQAEEDGEQTAERYGGYARADWRVSPRLAITSGWQGEQNEFAGIELRSTVDLGVSWKAVERERWTVDTVSSGTWNYEDPLLGGGASNVGLLLMARSRYEISENASTSQMVRVEPNLEDADDYRVEARAGLRSEVTELIGVKLTYELRYDGEPVPGFDRTDTLATVALVMNLGRTEAE